MQSYQHILLAVDFSDADSFVIERAVLLAKQHEAKISIIHVVDNLPVSEPGYDVVNSLDLELTEVLIDKAKQQLSKLAERLSVPDERCHQQMGRPVSEITALAEDEHVDLIIIGSHGRHGLGLLLGSTANGVLHHAKCDVLAVRIYDD